MLFRRKRCFWTLLLALVCGGAVVQAQESLQPLDSVQVTPARYGVLRKPANAGISIDGQDKEKAWERTPWTSEFIDIEGEGKPKPDQATKVKMRWDDQYLYLYAKLDETHVWGTLRQRDTIIYHNNDFEVFLKPFDDQDFYYEIEVNALNTVMDLLMPAPYRLGGDALMHWDVKGLQTAVHVEGTLNDPRDEDRYWAVEMAIPFASLRTFSGPRQPKVGDVWRIDFSRVQWQHEMVDGRYERKREKGRLLPENNWVWSPIGVIDMHNPDRWGYIQFLDGE